MQYVILLALVLAELSALALAVALAFGLAGDSRAKHACYVGTVVAGIIVLVLNYAGIRGLLRRLHDALFANAPSETIRYLFFLRYPLLCLTLLVSLPWLATKTMPRLLDSLFSVSSFDLFWIGTLCGLNSWSIMVVIELVVMYGPYRFGGEGLHLRPGWLRWLAPMRHVLYALLGVPIVLTACNRVDYPGWGIFWAVAGFLCAFLILLLTAWQREQVVSAGTEPSHLLVNGSWFRRRWNADEDEQQPDAPKPFVLLLRFLGPGYYDDQRQQPQPGHLLALCLLLALGCLYVLIGFAFRPSGGFGDVFPALGYLLVVLLLLVWALPAASFFFDRWRVPVVPALFVTVLATYGAANTDHFYQTRAAPADRVVSLSPTEALDAWLEVRPESSHRMAVVALSGGGIAAAAWGAEVLTGLEGELGRPFTESLHVLCGASGGSVAMIHYLDGFHAQRPRSPDELERIRRAASHSTLAALTWGVAYPDLWRLMAPPVMSWFPYQDRGWALQEAWRSLLRYPDATLHTIRRQIRNGTVPVPLFDATVVDTGRQFVISPVDVHRAGGNRFRACQSFFGEYPERDLDLVTAARLSATFPWVSPICRASRDSGGVGWHIADAAYFDNYGTVSLIEWLNTVLPRYTRLVPRPKLLFIRITIRELQFAGALEKEKPGWTYTLYGPLTTLLATGATSQLARNDHMLEALLERWADRGEVDIEVVDFPLRIEAPLSWQLTPESLAEIRSRWADEVSRGEQWKKVQQFYGH
ncbi:MAG: hypothetical protein KatS3mg109_1511 [Pirellulaceae bacterium]|nr:MAG: hypothetical protein KatS3mg109_1511 [Pirellulaceae bacterium]